jgi:hypothetical protein
VRSRSSVANGQHGARYTRAFFFVKLRCKAAWVGGCFSSPFERLAPSANPVVTLTALLVACEVSLLALKKVGHAPTLASAFLYFDVSFMVWVILGPLGPFIGEALKLSATQKGLLTAVPLLGGSMFRPVLGWSTEQFGARRTGLVG